MHRLLSVLLAFVIACGAGCGGGTNCNNTCRSAGATQCSGPQVQTCTADANGCLAWSAAASCGAQRFCSAAANACVACAGTCSSPGSTHCSGAQVQTCSADANGCLSLSVPAACPPGQECLSGQNRCVGPSCSTPKVVAASAPVGPSSDPGTCLRPVGQSAFPADQVQHMGTRTVGDVVSFNVAAGTGSFSIVSQAMNASASDVTFIFGGQDITVPNSVVPVIVSQPDGTTFYDDNAAPPSDPATALAAYAGLTPSTGAFTAPNTTASLNAFDGGVPAGTWSFKVSDFAAECASFGPGSCRDGGSATSTYDISVLTVPARGRSSGTVDVSFYLVTNSITAASAVSNAGMLRMLSTLETIYGRAGVCLGTVTFYDVPAWARAKFATGVAGDRTGPCDELDQMSTLSIPGNTLNFFFVDDIRPSAASGIGTVVGIDGSIPGPSTFGGTVHSGAVVNASDLGHGTCGSSIDLSGCGSDVVAYITAHEGGHWMGLYHSTESFGSTFDPVADTGQCVCTQCAPVASQPKCAANHPSLSPGQLPTQVTVADCNKGGSCDGSQFLMFWLFDATSLGQFSAQQAQIVRANPVVH